MKVDRYTAEVTNAAYRSGARYKTMCELADYKDMRYAWRKLEMKTTSGSKANAEPLQARKVEAVARLALSKRISFNEADSLARVQTCSDDHLTQAARDAYDAYMNGDDQ
jgi:hypothetical protein